MRSTFYLENGVMFACVVFTFNLQALLAKATYNDSHTADSSGAVGVRCLAQGHRDTQRSRGWN